MKQFFEDLFSSESKIYWKEEGNNKRMRFYNNFSKILRWMQLLFILLLTLYIISASTNTFIEILIDSDITIKTKEFLLQNPLGISISNIYEIFFVLIIFLNILEYKLCPITKYDLCKKIIRSLLIFPIVTLIILHLIITKTFMQIFWISIIFISINLIINILNNRIEMLCNIALGKTN